MTNDGIKLDMRKVKTIQEWKWLSTQMGLGLANYYCRFIRDISKVFKTLSHLLEKNDYAKSGRSLVTKPMRS